jgi:hypothetical protein
MSSGSLVSRPSLAVTSSVCSPLSQRRLLVGASCPLAASMRKASAPLPPTISQQSP